MEMQYATVANFIQRRNALTVLVLADDETEKEKLAQMIEDTMKKANNEIIEQFTKKTKPTYVEDNPLEQALVMTLLNPNNFADVRSFLSSDNMGDLKNQMNRLNENDRNFSVLETLELNEVSPEMIVRPFYSCERKDCIQSLKEYGMPMVL